MYQGTTAVSVLGDKANVCETALSTGGVSAKCDFVFSDNTMCRAATTSRLIN